MSGRGSNFAYLAVYDAQLARLGALAELRFHDDPNSCLIKLRQFAELLAQHLAARMGLYTTADEPFNDLLKRLKAERAMPREAGDLFHQLRIVGNAAAHAHKDDHADALTALKVARQLAIWFHTTFGRDKAFKPGPFIPPASPSDISNDLRAEIERLSAALRDSQSAAERARADADQQAREKETAQETARREATERALWEQLAQEAETHKLQLAAELAALQKSAEAEPPKTIAFLHEKAESAARAIDLDEAATRAIIDQQLRNRGWMADSRTLTFAAGARPAKGQNMAIAEWPTATGPADYALFAGLTLLGVVEAKRQRKNVSAALTQSERYSKGVKLGAEGSFAGGPWGEFKVPFLFAINGRPYLKQIETESGIWFRDARSPTNLVRPLSDWFTPEGLKAELEIDRDKADAALKTEPFNFGFPLRPYQQSAIEAIESGLADGRRAMLAAMATGTGKTKLAIAFLYRVLAAGRFRRVCFVVDRSALGNQTRDEFTTTKVVGPRAFADIFGLKGLEDIAPDLDTRVHICTIQGLVKRVLYAAEPADVPPIDQYDLMLIDECHRGYLLDREMSDAELGFRSQDDYVSKYRRVLEHFDAVKIGLTATPALHTVQIFGDPVFTYSYREASGTTRQRVSGGNLKKMPVSVPPLPEQRRIVAKLDGLRARSSRARNELDRIPNLIERYKQAILAKAFSGELTANWRAVDSGTIDAAQFVADRQELIALIAGEAGRGRDEKSALIATDEDLRAQLCAASEDNELPDKWTWASLGQVCGIYVGATPSRKEAGYWGGNINWVSSGEVAFCRISGTEEHITQAGLNSASTRIHPPGTVLLGMIGEGKTRGQAAILDVPACNNQNCAAIRVSEAGDPPKYVYWYLYLSYEKTRTSGAGNNQPALNKDRVQRLPIPLAPPDEALQVVAAIETAFEWINRIERDYSLAERLLPRLDGAILAKAFRGELVPQDPNDEPASVLLERIKAQREHDATRTRRHAGRHG